MKTIHNNESLLNGWHYRVTADKKTANIQERSPKSNSYKTVKKMTRKDFDDWAEENNLYNPYDQNPAKLKHLISADKYDD